MQKYGDAYKEVGQLVGAKEQGPLLNGGVEADDGIMMGWPGHAMIALSAHTDCGRSSPPSSSLGYLLDLDALICWFSLPALTHCGFPCPGCSIRVQR